MAGQPLPTTALDEAKAAVRQYGSIAAAAREMGIPRTTLQYRLGGAKRETDRLRFYHTPDREEIPRYHQPKPRYAIHPAEPPQQFDHDVSQVEHIMIVPDRHRDPRHPHRIECDRWIAMEGAVRKPKYVIDLGDHMTFDSVSRHDKNDTAKGRLKPTIKQDLDHMEASLRAFREGQGSDWKPILKKAQGNHEARLWAFENQSPESVGTHTHTYSQLLLQFGWKEYGFGEIFYVGGCGFVHAPINGMGRPMGGKTSSQRAGAMLCTSLFHGHSHRRGMYDDAKLDPRGGVTVVECGCALPWAEIEDYATISPIGWWWGIGFAKVANGVVLDLDWVSMKTLAERYG